MVSLPIGDADFIFKNTPIRVTAVRNFSKIKLVGLTVGPLEEGNEYQIRFWIAETLAKAGVVRFREEEMLGASTLYKIQWTERIQSVSRLSSLPEGFYSKLRYLLSKSKSTSRNNLEKMREYERIKRLAQDIVNCRLKKIISLASTSGHVTQILKNLTAEELKFYEDLNKIISEWKTRIL